MTRAPHRVRAAALAVRRSRAAASPAQGQPLNSPHVGYVYPGRRAAGHHGAGGRSAGASSRARPAPCSPARGLRADIVGYDKPLNRSARSPDLREKAQELQKRRDDAGRAPAARGDARPHRRLGAAQREPRALRNRDARGHDRRRCGARARAAAAGHAARPLEPGGLLRRPAPGSRRAGTGSGTARRRTRRRAIARRGAARTAGRDPGDRRSASRCPSCQRPDHPADARQAPAAAAQPNQYLPGDADRYRFDARKGQDLVIAVSARDLMPYLADAVPGWFQATVALFDAGGQRSGVRRRLPLPARPGAALPDSRRRRVHRRDQGRDLSGGARTSSTASSIGELPFVTSIFPLGGPAGAKTAVEVTGWNLPDRQRDDGCDGRRAGHGDAHGAPRRARVEPRALRRGQRCREIVEREPNNAPNEAAEADAAGHRQRPDPGRRATWTCSR